MYKIYILTILQNGNVTHYDQILSHNPGVDKNIEDKKGQLTVYVYLMSVITHDRELLQSLLYPLTSTKMH